MFDCSLFCRLPQYVYPSAAYLAAAQAGATPGLTMAGVIPQSPLSPTAGAPYFEYPAATAAGLTAAATQLPNGFEAAYPTTGYVAPAGYSYAIPQQIGPIAAYQVGIKSQTLTLMTIEFVRRNKKPFILNYICTDFIIINLD